MMTRLLTFLVLMITPAAQSGPGIDAAEMMRHVQSRYDSTRDFTAHVRQEIVLAASGKSVTSEGRVVFERPGKMRWTLRSESEEQVIVADGKTLWLYQPQDHQVLKAAYRAAFRSSTPISFLTGVGKLSKDFKASVEGRDADGRWILVLTPRDKDNNLGALRLRVRADTYDIVGAEIRDLLGNVTRIQFTDLKRNVGVDEKTFQLTVPSGVDVVEAPLGY